MKSWGGCVGLGVGLGVGFGVGLSVGVGFSVGTGVSAAWVAVGATATVFDVAVGVGDVEVVPLLQEAKLMIPRTRITASSIFVLRFRVRYYCQTGLYFFGEYGGFGWNCFGMTGGRYELYGGWG